MQDVLENTENCLKHEVNVLSRVSHENFMKVKTGHKNLNVHKISESAYKELRRALRMAPRRYGLYFSVWNGRCVYLLLTEKFKLKVTWQYVYYYLKKMGFESKVATEPFPE